MILLFFISLLFDNLKYRYYIPDACSCVGRHVWVLADVIKDADCLGGSNAMWNLHTTCTTCNRQKGDKTDAEYRTEFALRKLLFGF